MIGLARNVRVHCLGDTGRYEYRPHEGQEVLLLNLNIDDIIVDEEDLTLKEYIDIQLNNKFWHPNVDIGWMISHTPNTVRLGFDDYNFILV